MGSLSTNLNSEKLILVFISRTYRHDRMKLYCGENSPVTTIENIHQTNYSQLSIFEKSLILKPKMMIKVSGAPAHFWTESWLFVILLLLLTAHLSHFHSVRLILLLALNGVFPFVYRNGLRCIGFLLCVSCCYLHRIISYQQYNRVTFCTRREIKD